MKSVDKYLASVLRDHMNCDFVLLDDPILVITHSVCHEFRDLYFLSQLAMIVLSPQIFICPIAEYSII